MEDGLEGIGIQEKVKHDNDINEHRKQKSKNQHTVTRA
jgi:hypothetical protein